MTMTMPMKSVRRTFLYWAVAGGCALSLTSACFITNCPPGGKRSIAVKEPSQQCYHCGPGASGRCFGPDICCGPEIGCQIRNRHTAVCRAENLRATPCRLPGKPCGSGEAGGLCAAPGVCCTNDHCSLDDSCEPLPNSNKDVSSSDWLRSIFKSEELI